MDKESTVPQWERWRRLAAPSLFLLGVIYYEELFLKLYCFRALTAAGALFTLLFTLPVALLLGLLCGGVPEQRGRILLPVCTGLVSLWIGSQLVYYHLFKTFLTIFSLTKMAMVAGAFGDMAVGEIFANWFPILMMGAPTLLAWRFRGRIIAGPDAGKGQRGAVPAVHLLPLRHPRAGGPELRRLHPDPAGAESGAVRHQTRPPGALHGAGA